MLVVIENIDQLENIFDDSNEIRQRLENIFRIPPDYSLMISKSSEISYWAVIANTTKDLSLKFNAFYNIGSLTLEFIQKYQNYIPLEICNDLRLFADSAIGRGKTNQAVFTILEGGQRDSSGTLIVKIENFSTAIRLIAEAIEGYWNTFSPEARESIKRNVHNLLEIESEAEFKGTGDKAVFNFHKETLRRTAGYILWKIEQFEKEKKVVQPPLQDVLNIAVQETEEMMRSGVDISNLYCMTPLEKLADKHPELAEQCNDFLMLLLKKQVAPPLPSSMEQVVSDEF